MESEHTIGNDFEDADVKLIREKRHRMFTDAIRSGNTSAALLCIQEGYDVRRQCPEAVHVAVTSFASRLSQNEDEEVGKYRSLLPMLLEQGFGGRGSLDVIHNGRTPLHALAATRITSSNNNNDTTAKDALTAFTQYLVEDLDADVLMVDVSTSETPIELSVAAANTSVFRALWSPSQSLKFSEDFRVDLFFIAVRRGRVGIVREMLSVGDGDGVLDPSCLNEPEGETALHVAARRADTEMVKLILERTRIPVYVRDVRGRTPLHSVAALSSEDGSNAIAVMAQLLLAAEKDEPEHGRELFLNAADKYGDTALHLAAREHKRLNCEFLIREGAEHKAKNRANTSAAASVFHELSTK